jgi:two-component system, chemotaxis family, response regulator Rcp1
MKWNTERMAEILLVEDNPGDVRLTREAFANSVVVGHLEVVGDGEEAMRYLYRIGPYAAARIPDVVLLDLNLPKKDGREVLAEMREDPTLRLVPVVVLTTSDAAADVARSYELHANCYVRKPLEYADFVETLRRIEQYWLCTATLPTRVSLGTVC